MDYHNNSFIGSTTGIIKGVSIRGDVTGIKIRIKNYVNSLISNNDEIHCMTWYDQNQNDILIGKKNGIKIYNTKDGTMNDILEGSEYSVRGVFNHEGILVFGTEPGIIRFWKYPYEKDKWEDLQIGNNLSHVKQSPLSANVFATCGKENDLKLWDTVTKQCTFNAKNIKPDELQLRVPVWVSDICFCTNSDKVAYCNRHGDIRLFDPLLPQRRPVINVHLKDEVFTCISTTPDDKKFLAGSGSGNLHLVDLRGKGSFVCKYKGFSGAVKGVTCSAGNNSLVFSVSLDRHFRIHDFETRNLLVKEYTQSRLTTVLIRDDFILEDLPTKENSSNSDETAALHNGGRPSVRRKENSGDSLEEVFNCLETVRDVLDMNKNSGNNNDHKRNIIDVRVNESKVSNKKRREKT